MHAQRPATASVSLRRMFPSASFVGCVDIAVQRATESSRDCVPGCLFAAIPGRRTDGRRYVAEAVERGAAAILTSTPAPEVDVPQCIVQDVRRCYAELCQAIHGFPSRRLGVAGVTGTNGKTTTTWLIRSILEADGRDCGLLGTVEYSDGIVTSAAGCTTPDPWTLADWMSAMVARRTGYAAIELSSHALDQHRAAGVLLDAAIVTNVTHDHFDYHGDRAAYHAAKTWILSMLKRGGLVILNADDPGSASFAERVSPLNQVCLVGLEEPADVTGRIMEASPAGTRFLVQRSTDQFEFFTPLIGRHNIENCLCAIAAASHFGLSLEDMADGLAVLPGVPGRLERIDCQQPFQVYVDYAHTADALRRVIAAVRPLTRGRVMMVFGAGGDRDPSKRPQMARAAAEADVCIVTSDNPRSESPEAIIADICTGFAGLKTEVHVEVDREQAIATAIRSAQPGDCLLVCGKGHERRQIIGEEQIPFDDAAICRQHLLHYRLSRRAAS